MKKILSFASLVVVSACTYGQQPAPYEAYGKDFYGKGGPKDNANANYVRAKNTGGMSPIYASQNELAASGDQDDYNRRIDEMNANRVSSRPLGSQIGSKQGEVYSHQTASTDSSGNVRRSLMPAPIDGDQQVIRVGSSRMQPVVTSSETQQIATYDNQRSGFFKEEPETVPPVEKKDSFINPTEKRTTSRNLDKVKPLPKPRHSESNDSGEEEIVQPAPKASVKPLAEEKHTPEVAEKKVAPAPKNLAEEKPKITPQVKKVETASTTMKPLDEPKDEEPAAEEANDEDKVESSPKPGKPGEETRKLVESKPIQKEEEPASGNAPDKIEIEKEEVAAPAVQSKPFIKPVDGQVISEFGGNKAGGGFNDGINIQAPEGTPVKAASGGTVVYSGNQLQGYGNLIIVRHPDGYLSSYSHLKDLELKKGDSIKQGEVLGHVGKTGNVESPQLHFGIRKGREPVDPKSYL